MNLVRIRLYGIIPICLLLVISSISCRNNAEESNSPILVVEKYIQACIGNDIEEFLETMTPSEVEELKEAFGEGYKDYVSQDFDQDSIQMQAYDMTYEEIPLVTQANKTIVLVTDGKIKYMGPDGNWICLPDSFTYKGAYFDTVNIDGSWYVENLLEVGDMRIILSEELKNEELEEIFVFLATIPSVDQESISSKNRHQLYEEYIDEYPEMAGQMAEEVFPFDGMIFFKVTDLKEVLPVREEVLDNMPYREAAKGIRTFSASAVSARKKR